VDADHYLLSRPWATSRDLDETKSPLLRPAGRSSGDRALHAV